MMQSCQSRCPVKLLSFILLQALASLVSAASAQLCAAVEGSDKAAVVRTGEHAPVNLYVWFNDTGQGVDTGGTPWHDFPIDATAMVSDTKVAAVQEVANDTAYHQLRQPPDKARYDDVNITAEVGLGDLTSDCKQLFEQTDWSDKTAKSSWRRITFRVDGRFIGRTKIQFSLGIPGNPTKVAKEVAVLRTKYEEFLNHTFVGTLALLIIMANVLMGFKLDLDVIKSVLQRPVAPLIGMLCQFAFMPLFAFGMAMALFRHQDTAVAMGLGMFVAGCSPGGGASNFWTLLLDGNVDLSVTMTFVSTTVALGLLPLWMFCLGRVLVSNAIVIPYKHICISLASIVIPLFVGILIKMKLKRVAACGLKILRPFVIFIILFICTFGVYANTYMFKLMTWEVLVGGLCLPWAGFFFGLIASLLARRPAPDVIAIAIETGVQNTGIAIVLLKLSFGQPDGDLASVIPVVVAIFTPAPLLVAVTIHYVSKWLKPKKDADTGSQSSGDVEGIMSNEKAAEIHANGTLLQGAGDETEQCLRLQYQLSTESI